MVRFGGVVGALCAGALLTSSASASLLFTSTNGSNRSAAAVFSVSGSSLTISLKNTGADVLVPIDVLTGVFFDVAGSPISFTRTSAVLGAGSVVIFPISGTGTDAGGVVGGEWAYKGGISGPGGTDYGISSAGLGLFGGGDRFPGSDLAPPVSPNGLEYGIVSALDNPATGNTPVTGSQPLIKNEVVFTLGGLPAGFDLNRIGNVRFQYGTALTEPNDPGTLIPTPASLALMAAGGLAMGGRKRR